MQTLLDVRKFNPGCKRPLRSPDGKDARAELLPFQPSRLFFHVRVPIVRLGDVFTGWRARVILLVSGLFVAVPPQSSAWVLNGYTWPVGSNIVMHLQLSRPPPVRFPDGSAGWNASAADALAIWNQHLDFVHFVSAGASTAAGGDRMNSVFFSNTIYGQTFGSHVLAVTMNYSGSGSTFSETDVIFNDAQRWSSYRGPLHARVPGRERRFRLPRRLTGTPITRPLPRDE